MKTKDVEVKLFPVDFKSERERNNATKIRFPMVPLIYDGIKPLYYQF